MKKRRPAFHQLISVTCDKAKKKRGDRKKEKGMRNNLMVEDENMAPVLCKLAKIQGML